MWEFNLARTADISILLPIIIFFVRGRLHVPLTYKLIYSIVFLLFVRNITTFILGELGIYNVYIYNWYNLIGSIIVGLLYYHLFENQYLKGFAILTICITVIAALFDYESLFNPATTNFNRFSYNISGCLEIILILIYFYQLLQGLLVPNLAKFSPFWFSAGALFYFSGTIFSYISINSTFNDLDVRSQYWAIDAFLSIIFNVFLAISVWYIKPVKVDN